MPFPFTLSTTSATSLADYLTSSTHPSLLLVATTHRSVLRDALKKHKRLPPSSQASHLPTVQDALTSYLPFALAIAASLRDRPVSGERVDIRQPRELEVEWRTTLTATIAGREPTQDKLRGVSNEVFFVLQTLAYSQVLLARVQISNLYGSTTPTADQRTGYISSAMKYLLEACRIHTFALSLIPSSTSTPSPVDIQPAVQSALASLALAEATLVVVLKDDPYVAAVAEDRNKESKDWMISAPSIPKVRAHLFARLCLAAADHAAKAAGLLPQTSSGKVDESLLRYVDNLRRTSRARAARFLGIDAELAGKTGEGIAWLHGAREELGLAVGDEDAGRRKGLKGLKQNWAEKREDRRVEKGAADWGMDGGRLEEARVVEFLESRWKKLNDTVNVQSVPAFEPLLASMPSGREYHSPKPFVPPMLDSGELARMRAPPDPNEEAYRGNNDGDSSDEEHGHEDPVGAFPGTSQQYTGSNTSYY